MAASVPERCPQCHSPVAERFPHAVMYDCGFSLFNDGQPVTDDYPAECQRRRIKRLEKQLTAASAEAERWKQQYEELRAGVERVVQDLHELTRATARDWRSDEFSPQLIAAAPAMLDAIEDILADCDAQDDDPEDYRARYYDLHVGHVQRLREIVADIYPDK